MGTGRKGDSCVGLVPPPCPPPSLAVGTVRGLWFLLNPCSRSPRSFLWRFRSGKHATVRRLLSVAESDLFLGLQVFAWLWGQDTTVWADFLRAQGETGLAITPWCQRVPRSDAGRGLSDLFPGEMFDEQRELTFTHPRTGFVVGGLLKLLLLCFLLVFCRRRCRRRRACPAL